MNSDQLPQNVRPMLNARTTALARVGRISLHLLSDIGGIVRLGVNALGPAPPRQVLLEMHRMANASLFFVVAVLGFTGEIMVLQAATQARLIIGDLTLVGPAFLQLVVSEFGPTIVALMLAARYGASVGAEIGLMAVTEQLDALRMAGTSPLRYVVRPKVLAGPLAMLALVVGGTAVAFFSGGTAATRTFGLSWDTYIGLHLTSMPDALLGLCKALAYGVAVPVVACYAGLRARGGARGVGEATTYAVIGGSIAVLALDLLIGATGYVLTTWFERS